MKGILNLDPPIFDVDWFAFAAEANTDYQFTANQGQRYPKLNVLRIFDDEGTELRNSLIKPRVEEVSLARRQVGGAVDHAPSYAVGQQAGQRTVNRRVRVAEDARQFRRVDERLPAEGVEHL